MGLCCDIAKTFLERMKKHFVGRACTFLYSDACTGDITQLQVHLGPRCCQGLNSSLHLPWRALGTRNTVPGEEWSHAQGGGAAQGADERQQNTPGANQTGRVCQE